MAAPTIPDPPPPSTLSRVSLETVEKAVDSLLTWRETKYDPSNPNLLEEDEFLYLVLNLKNAPPKGRTNPFKIPLPHPLHASDSTKICLLIDDRPKSGLTKDEAEKKIEDDGVPVAEVITLSKLRSDYRPFDAKRRLCDSFDAFFADKRIVPALPNLLGKGFSKKKKSPVPVDLTHKNWKEQIGRVCGSAVLFLKEGAFIVLKAGRVSMAREEIVENVMAAIEGAAEVVPESWGNVRSFKVKLAGSSELLVYQAAPEVKVRVERIRAKEEEGGDGEVTVESKIGKKKKALKKGRIHEVQCMDSIGEVVDDKNDALKMGDGENVEAEDMGSVGKKRKKDGKVKLKKESGDDLEIVDAKKRKKNGKVKSTENGEAKKDELAVKGEEEHVKTKKDKYIASGKKVKGKTKKRSIAAE